MSPGVSFVLREGGPSAGAHRAPSMVPGHQPERNRRPLYLCARLKARVDADGPALRVRSAGQAEARYPLCRVSRVIANTRVDWSAAALRACLELGIPIVIVAGSGAPLGSVQPALAGASRLAEAMDEMLDRPDWREIYENWLRSVRMRVLSDGRSEREAAGNPLAPGEFKEIARRFVYVPAGAIASEGSAGLWRAGVRALAAAALHRAGLQPLHWGAGGVPLNILDDVAGVLELRLRLEVRAGMERGLTGDAVTLRVFHALSDKLDAQCWRILMSLARRVKQVVAEWH